ncbi:M20 family metallopeptidase [Staphylococcus lloydii]|uniref:M20 family metallopeptidase n=1 Tax=Staphylococcus lloydii TaxID=2781774 RepID=UPI0029295471|nr:M20 family metallopeptidase [Staphylococcus lloydii]MDU9418598.1 M20 family metallopeptidase [Staphylococcus lloydii]
MSRIKDYIAEHEADIIADIKALVQKQSPTAQKEAVDAAGLWIQDKIKSYLDIEPEIIEQQHTGNHIRFHMGEGDEQILVSGHFDTVWGFDDLALIEDGDTIYGPGVIDMKTGVVQVLWALRALKEQNIPTAKKVVVLFNGDHEGIASPTSRPYIEEESRNSVYGLVAEAATGESGALKTFRKGIYRYTIDFKGISAHAGNDHQAGESAILEAAHFIERLESFTNYDTGTTVNVGTITGGTGINVRPDSAQIKIDVRVKNNDEGQKIDECIQGLEPQNSKIEVTIDGGEVRPVMEKTDATEQLFQQAQALAQDLDFELEQVAVGGGSDGSFIAAQGTPTLDGLGGVGGGPHARNEHINKTYVVDRTSLLATLFEQL